MRGVGAGGLGGVQGFGGGSRGFGPPPFPNFKVLGGGKGEIKLSQISNTPPRVGGYLKNNNAVFKIRN